MSNLRDCLDKCRQWYRGFPHEFRRQTAIVTGGGRDIGRACAMRLAKDGANVVINYHSSSEGADSAVKEIIAMGGKAFAKQGDMTKQADVEALIAETQKEFGEAINVLVHVTGGLVARKTFDDMDHDHWSTVMDLNVTSLFHLSKACLLYTSPSPRDRG